MQSGLNPSAELFAATELYNFFPLSPGKTREDALHYLSNLYNTHLSSPPLSEEDQLKKILDTPDYAFIYKMVEIQKIVSETGFLKFEGRESGCIPAFFLGYATSLSSKPPYPSTIFNTLHYLNTTKVKIKLEDHPSGSFRQCREFLSLSYSDITPAGIEQIINYIESGMLSGMVIAGAQDMKMYEKLRADAVQKSRGADELENILKEFAPGAKYEDVDQLRDEALRLHQEADKLEQFIIKQSWLSNVKKKNNVTTNAELAQVLYDRLKETNQLYRMEFIDSSKIDTFIQMLIEQINDLIPNIKAKSDTEKLDFIYEQTQILLLIHPFVNANNRTILNQFTLNLHRDLNLPEPIFFNPMFPYAMSREELIEMGKLSCALNLALEEYVKTGTSSIFVFPKLSEQEIKLLTDYVKPVKAEALRLYAIKFVENKLTTILQNKMSTIFSKATPLINIVMNAIKKCKTTEEVINQLDVLITKHSDKPVIAKLCKEVNKELKVEVSKYINQPVATKPNL